MSAGASRWRTRGSGFGASTTKHCGRSLVSLNFGGCALTEFDIEDIAATCFHKLEELVLWSPFACCTIDHTEASFINPHPPTSRWAPPAVTGRLFCCRLRSTPMCARPPAPKRGTRGTLDLRGLPITDGVIRTCIRATCLETLVVSRNVTDECVGTLKGRFGKPAASPVERGGRRGWR
jgi:hypothetical protein